MNLIKNQIKDYSLRQYILRMLTALLFVVLFVNLHADIKFMEQAFYNHIDWNAFVVEFVILFVLLCMICSDKIITIMLIGIVEWYFVTVSADMKAYMFSFGLCLVLCAVVIFSNTNEIRINPKQYVVWCVCGLLIIAFTIFVGSICCLYYKNHWTPCYDFGLFSQMFYYMKETGKCLITCERDVLLNHFAVHFSPIYYVILPIYMLIPEPCTLLVVQAFIVASGVIPVVALCKNYKLSNMATILFAVCYILYPAFLGGCFWYLHENCFLAPLILWCFYFLEKNHVWKAVGVAILTLFVKEDAAIYVAVIAFYFVLARRNYKSALTVFGLSIVYFFTVTHLMTIYGEGVMADVRYSNYMYEDGGMITILKAVIQNPAYAISQIFKQDRLLFLLQMFVPLCFLPLAIKRPEKLLLFIPMVLINLMPSHPYQYDIGYQYAFGSGSILIYLAISNYAEMNEKRKNLLLCAALGSCIIFAGGYYSKNEYFESYELDTEQREIIDEALALVPEDASVAASTFLLANVSQRMELYELETTKQETEYIVMDLRYANDKVSIDDYLNKEYTAVYYEDGIIAILKHDDMP